VAALSGGQLKMKSLLISEWFINMKLYQSAIYWPSSLVAPFSWVGHLHFAHWLVARTKPTNIIELGTHTGNSFFAFCDAVKQNNLDCTCTAVDTWKGDAHANFYDESVFEGIKSKVTNFGFLDIAVLKRMTFDEALNETPDASVDVLHIDGFHTYEAVKHDFMTWRPKMRSGGIVLLHDTAIKREGFGVEQFWDELLAQGYDGFNFPHSCGLGVLVIQNEDAPLITLREKLGLSVEEYTDLPRLFFALADRVTARIQVAKLTQQINKNANNSAGSS
jgi:hypothetical protein